MSKIVGIDLGTTNSLVAAVDSGIPYVIADAEGQRLTPSVVHYPAAGAPLVGRKAGHVRVLKPAETVYSIKRFMGRRGVDIPREEMLVTYPVRGEGAGPVTVDIHGVARLPEEISAELLKKLKLDAEAALGEPVSRAVITVPAYFNDAQRNATKQAGELAGFAVERILNEPTAAALAYGLDKLKDRAKIAVYDLGGGTFDLSILELHDGVFQVLATNGNTRLGGDDLDRRLIDFLVTEIARDGGPDLRNAERGMQNAESDAGLGSQPVGFPLTPALSPTGGEGARRAGEGEVRGSSKAVHDEVLTPENLALLARLREAAEQAKIRLSSEPEIEITLPFLTSNYSFNRRLSRTELEDLTRDIIHRTRAHCLRSLADAKLEARELDQVILVGGQTRMPLVRRMVTEIFGCAEFAEDRGSIRIGAEYHRPPGPLLNTSQNPDEAVALGAAIQAEILSGGFKNLLLLDVTPLSLGLETFGGLMNVILPRNSTIPVKAGEVFTTAVDYQPSMLIHVLQGERERAKDNWSLGRFTIGFERAPKGGARVGVQFEIDANGILHVLARDLKTGTQTVVEMKSAVDVDDAEVQKMVEESVEHAFDDLHARRWIETRLRAEETLAATHKGMSEFAGELDAAYQEKLRTAVRTVEDLLAQENPETKVGDPVRLKAALTELDEATKPLAELMMDRAMEALLRKRGIIQ